ncbi:hypothetical protein ELE36_12870 [Pseudolysobacter antarcticus]|uniref:Uncharacterized protein n=1 Tax=Pseudolysobacter antarcticus TaxID=2511995 RepID=A0A411HKW5_9GAMM|nr:hypothetical protein [Pseudolysobacter antarcticus]QBB71172.1 hypothetical protein ELE36_12870 [Pseudolysobacter antarcticus]
MPIIGLVGSVRHNGVEPQGGGSYSFSDYFMGLPAQARIAEIALMALSMDARDVRMAELSLSAPVIVRLNKMLADNQRMPVLMRTSAIDAIGELDDVTRLIR